MSAAFALPRLPCISDDPIRGARKVVALVAADLSSNPRLLQAAVDEALDAENEPVTLEF